MTLNLKAAHYITGNTMYFDEMCGFLSFSFLKLILIPIQAGEKIKGKGNQSCRFVLAPILKCEK